MTTGTTRGSGDAGATGVEVARRVQEIGTLITDSVEELADLVASQLSAQPPRRADLAIEKRCRELMAQPELPLAGAGFVAANGVLADARYWLEWWTANPDDAASLRKLAAETDPTSIGFRDYTELSWFVTPRDSGRLCVTGPYVDYMCTDQHTLTTTLPVSDRGGFLGVVGVDLLVATMERLLRSELDAVAGVCVVVNAAGRVVASSDPVWVVGDLVRGLPFDEWFAETDARPVRVMETPARDEPSGWSFIRCQGLPLGVLVRP